MSDECTCRKHIGIGAGKWGTGDVCPDCKRKMTHFQAHTPGSSDNNQELVVQLVDDDGNVLGTEITDRTEEAISETQDKLKGQECIRICSSD